MQIHTIIQATANDAVFLTDDQDITYYKREAVAVTEEWQHHESINVHGQHMTGIIQ